MNICRAQNFRHFSALAWGEEKHLLREDISAHVAQLQGMQSLKRTVFFCSQAVLLKTKDLLNYTEQQHSSRDLSVSQNDEINITSNNSELLW